jgi:hypothetical protein
VAVAVAVEVAVAVVVVGSSVVAGWVLSTVVTVVAGLLVRSASMGAPVRSSQRNAESNVERVMATIIAPKSTTGASAALRGNSAHGESPAWVRLRTR